jgi:hypothetical protein
MKTCALPNTSEAILVPLVDGSAAPLSPATLPLSQAEAPFAADIGALSPSTADWVSEAKPWSQPVQGRELLDALTEVFKRFVVLPRWGAETLALWTLHTYAFELRDVTTYIGIESPLKRCGKSTLLSVLSRFVNRPVVSTNISPPAFFRVIAETRPTLLIDEADRLLKRNDELSGILNSGYTRATAYVVRTCPFRVPQSAARGSDPNSGRADPTAAPVQSIGLARFSAWCPKALAGIGCLPDTLADRCILIRMQRKTPNEECERLRNLTVTTLREQCARFVLDHGTVIARAHPAIPTDLNDRAADIWEPLLVLADLAGEPWPEMARQAAIGLSALSNESNPLGLLLLDIFILIAQTKENRLPSRKIVEGLSASRERPWTELAKGQVVTELWLAQQLRPLGIRPHPIWIGGVQARGYLFDDFRDAFKRYIPQTEFDALKARLAAEKAAATLPVPPPAPTR